MPQPGTLAKATLSEMWPGPDNVLKVQDKDGNEAAAKKVTVQFNPESLKVSFSNQAAGGDQPGGGSTQFVGQGTTKLSLELWFDVTLPLPAGTPDPQGDVRNLTKDVAFFMSPETVTRNNETGRLPPAVEFHWGTFLFKGTVDSLDETLEMFSEEGKPLRASMQLSLSKQDLKFDFGDPSRSPRSGGGGGGGGGGAPGAGPGARPAGTQPMAMAREGDTVQGAAARAGASDWKAVAVANGIENPRIVPPGALLNVSGAASASGAASLGLTGATAAGAAASLSAPAAAAAGSITVAGAASGSSGLTASTSLRFTGPSGPTI